MTLSKKTLLALALGSFVSGFFASWLISIFTREQLLTTPGQGKEIASVLSANKMYKARIWLPILDGMGATVSQPFQVWLEDTRINDQSRLIFEADKTDAIRLKWIAPLELEVCYEDAQIHRFSNRFVGVDRSNGFPEAGNIEVVLRKAKLIGDC